MKHTLWTLRYSSRYINLHYFDVVIWIEKYIFFVKIFTFHVSYKLSLFYLLNATERSVKWKIGSFKYTLFFYVYKLKHTFFKDDNHLFWYWYWLHLFYIDIFTTFSPFYGDKKKKKSVFFKYSENWVGKAYLCEPYHRSFRSCLLSSSWRAQTSW